LNYLLLSRVLFFSDGLKWNQKSYLHGLDKNFDLSDETIKRFLLPLPIKQRNSLEPTNNTIKIKSGGLITFLINKKMKKRQPKG